MAEVIVYGMPTGISRHPAVSCTRRVLVTLVEKGVPYELVTIDLAKGDHKKPAFLEMQVS